MPAPGSSALPRILIVDDDFNITEGLKDILEDVGYYVESAALGDEALDRLLRTSFHLMIVDYSLPDTNGVLLAREAHRLYPVLGIILMTGHSAIEIAEKTEQAEELFCARLRKPVDADLIRTTVRQRLLKQGVALGAIEPPTAAAPSAPPAEIPLDILPTLRQPAQEPRARTFWTLIISVIVAGGVGFSLGRFSAQNEDGSGHGSLSHALRDSFTAKPAPKAVPEAPPVVQAGTPAVPVRVAQSPAPASKPARHPSPAAAHPTKIVRKPMPPSSSAESKAELKSADPLAQLVAVKRILISHPTDADAAATLLQLLQNSDGSVRLAATQLVASTAFSDDRFIQALSAALKDPYPNVAQAAAAGLGEMGTDSPEAIESLCAVLADKATTTRRKVGEAAQNALVRIGAPAVPSLIKSLSMPSLQPEAIDALGQMGQAAQPALPALQNLKSDPALSARANNAINHIKEAAPASTPLPTAAPAINTPTVP